ncbi:lipoprotein signal peptidase [Paucihalobacter ruber]|uniref:Lipoprotein signal peptidase n=1 Tax=Paucihalobacter ruber TaxID=2567861 RepID=A0A506PNE3_9FLAO|nr:lipoprotein signal peptidase [Paucihalobacter ruber]TPV34717.1 lipoprotein signal peptidase [Paucihalobacter ruber]
MNLKQTSILIAVILLADQISKFYIKTHFLLNEEVEILSWFKITFVENDGMAWGAKISDLITFMSERTAKLILTLFRIVALAGIGYWLWMSIKNKAKRLLIISVAVIFAGALGNILDSVFYGILFNDSFNEVATFLPEQGGYDSLFHGKVVDMIHLPIYSGILPSWVPFLGGQHFSFFDPVFNIADIAISTGFCLIIFFNKRIFDRKSA